MNIPFAKFIEDHNWSFQVLVKNKSDEIELFEALFNDGLSKDDSVVSYIDNAVLSETTVIRYPRQVFFRPVVLDGEYGYLFKGWMDRSLSDLYLKETYTPYRFEEVIEYYLGSRDQQLDLEVTNGDLLCLM